MVFNPDDIVRFWSYVEVDSSDKCWIWTGYIRTQYGNGSITIRGKAWLIHRLSYVLKYGDIPKGLEVCHKCDNPKCVNPNHLFLGTHLDNMRDMVIKGRKKKGDEHYYRKYPELIVHGENHGGAKLTENQIKEIRTKYPIIRDYKKLGKQYGVAGNTIKSIVTYKTWKRMKCKEPKLVKRKKK